MPSVSVNRIARRGGISANEAQEIVDEYRNAEYVWDNHHCPICSAGLNSHKAVVCCVKRDHVEPCVGFHPSLHRFGTSSRCNTCNKEDAAHEKAHKKILDLIRPCNAKEARPKGKKSGVKRKNSKKGKKKRTGQRSRSQSPSGYDTHFERLDVSKLAEIIHDSENHSKSGKIVANLLDYCLRKPDPARLLELDALIESDLDAQKRRETALAKRRAAYSRFVGAKYDEANQTDYNAGPNGSDQDCEACDRLTIDRVRHTKQEIPVDKDAGCVLVPDPIPVPHIEGHGHPADESIPSTARESAKTSIATDRYDESEPRANSENGSAPKSPTPVTAEHDQGSSDTGQSQDSTEGPSTNDEVAKKERQKQKRKEKKVRAAKRKREEKQEYKAEEQTTQSCVRVVSAEPSRQDENKQTEKARVQSWGEVEWKALANAQKVGDVKALEANARYIDLAGLERIGEVLDSTFISGDEEKLELRAPDTIHMLYFMHAMSGWMHFNARPDAAWMLDLGLASFDDLKSVSTSMTAMIAWTLSKTAATWCAEARARREQIKPPASPLVNRILSPIRYHIALFVHYDRVTIFDTESPRFFAKNVEFALIGRYIVEALDFRGTSQENDDKNLQFEASLWRFVGAQTIYRGPPLPVGSAGNSASVNGMRLCMQFYRMIGPMLLQSGRYTQAYDMMWKIIRNACRVCGTGFVHEIIHLSKMIDAEVGLSEAKHAAAADKMDARLESCYERWLSIHRMEHCEKEGGAAT